MRVHRAISMEVSLAPTPVSRFRFIFVSNFQCRRGTPFVQMRYTFNKLEIAFLTSLFIKIMLKSYLQLFPG